MSLFSRLSIVLAGILTGFVGVLLLFWLPTGQDTAVPTFAAQGAACVDEVIITPAGFREVRVTCRTYLGSQP